MKIHNMEKSFPIGRDKKVGWKQIDESCSGIRLIEHPESYIDTGKATVEIRDAYDYWVERFHVVTQKINRIDVTCLP